MGVFEYLESMPGTTLRRLYQHPSTALAVFRRMLPHLAKTFVMSMLYLPKPLPVSELALWMKSGSAREKERALGLLSRLNMVTSISATKETPQCLVLSQNFAASLRIALTGGDIKQSFGIMSTEPVGEKIDIPFLDDYAQKQWESILHYVVNSVGDSIGSQDGPSLDVRNLLEAGELVKKSGRAVEITTSGFTFLLQEVNAQVWTLLILFVKHQEADNFLAPEILSFLFMLGSLELGRAYDTKALSREQGSLLGHLSNLGLIYVPSSNSTQFFPTRLATTLTSDASALRSISNDAMQNSAGNGFIIIETNYRLYAYTKSPLQIAVLNLFTKLNARYPDMVAGRISRSSIREAIRHGITSDQIISYLTTHAHPQLIKSSQDKHTPILPPTVVDQIRLWQIENERMKATSGFLFKDFTSQAEYEGPCKYAEEIGVRRWKNDAKRMFFVTRHEQIATYIKQNKSK